MTIRVGKPGELEKIKSVNEHFANDDYSHTDEFFVEGLENGRVFVAEVEGEIVGYTIYCVLWGNTPFLELLRIAPGFQRQGLGTGLVKAVEDKVREDGFESLTISSSLDNPNGNAFHQKLGFERIGQLEMFFGPEVFYMKKVK